MSRSHVYRRRHLSLRGVGFHFQRERTPENKKTSKAALWCNRDESRPGRNESPNYLAERIALENLQRSLIGARETRTFNGAKQDARDQTGRV